MENTDYTSQQHQKISPDCLLHRGKYTPGRRLRVARNLTLFEALMETQAFLNSILNLVNKAKEDFFDDLAENVMELEEIGVGQRDHIFLFCRGMVVVVADE